MKKAITIIAFQIGVDCLGFPQFHNHKVETINITSAHKLPTSKYFKPFSK